MVSEAGNSGTGTGAHDLVQSLHSAIGGGEGPRTEDGARGMLRGVEGNRFSGAGAECEVGASRGGDIRCLGGTHVLALVTGEGHL